MLIEILGWTFGGMAYLGAWIGTAIGAGRSLSRAGHDGTGVVVFGAAMGAVWPITLTAFGVSRWCDE